MDFTLGYFKITLGTGLKGSPPCRCPYCGHSGPQNTFWTTEQIEYAKSVAFRQISDAVFEDLKELEIPAPRRGFGIGLTVTRTSSHPIRYYREKQLETEIVCDACALRYAIYGVFGWCPDCGAHNSRQILEKNLEFARKELALAASVDKEFLGLTRARPPILESLCHRSPMMPTATSSR